MMVAVLVRDSGNPATTAARRGPFSTMVATCVRDSEHPVTMVVCGDPFNTAAAAWWYSLHHNGHPATESLVKENALLFNIVRKLSRDVSKEQITGFSNKFWILIGAFLFLRHNSLCLE